MNIHGEIDTLVTLSWDAGTDDDTRDSMVSHFSHLDAESWEEIKNHVKHSDTVQRVIDTIDILRDLGLVINEH